MLKLFCLLLPALAYPNTSGPLEVGALPSFALSQGPADVQVLAEELEFDCRFAVCTVRAVYEVEAAREMELRFKFFLPTKRHINAKVGDKEIPSIESKPAPDEERRKWNFRSWQSDDKLRVPSFAAKLLTDEEFRKKSPSEYQRLSAQYRTLELYEADFQGLLPAGRSKLAVDYQQPLYAHLGIGRSSGYYGFDYYLKPLKEWKRPESFTLNIHILWDLPPGAGKRSIDCSYPEPADGTKLSAPRETRRVTGAGEVRRQEYEARFQGAFPDQLNCSSDVEPELKRVYHRDTAAWERAFRREQDAD